MAISPDPAPLTLIYPALAWAHPLVQEWFLSTFGSPTEPQEQGWPHIHAGRTTLISAPTGSGKTLAAFLACIDGLVRKALSGDLEDRTEVIYVSPLKALGNDIQKNLEIPLGGILQLAGRKGILMPEIRTAVRTGDTLMHERRAMLRRPPHILVTTPESLYILLTAESSRRILRDAKTVIVDEIHALAGNKRGTHLALSLERLEALTGRPLSRIGLSATQKPLDQIAHFLTGAGRSDPAVVNIGYRRQMDIGIELPISELGPVASNEMWDEIYDRIAALAREHRSTLVFVNTRRMAERIAMHLAERLGEEAVAAHHGSLSRKLRLTAERKLKNGEVAVLVATASLELGIDIGFVDLVVQVGSPRAIAIGLQRIGRSGHWRGAIPKARLFATTRDELIECAALVRAIHHGELDRIVPPECPLDILAQQIVAECASRTAKPQSPLHLEVTTEENFPLMNADQRRSESGEKEYEERAHSERDRNMIQSNERVPHICPPLVDVGEGPDVGKRELNGFGISESISGSPDLNSGIAEDELFSLLRRAYPYRDLARNQFDAIVAMLSDGIAARRGRYGAYLHHDRVHERLRARRGARLAAITSGGAIADNGNFNMVSLPDGVTVGTLDEDFAVESNRGDIILLGNTSWRIHRIEAASGRVLVEDAHGAPPNVPFWRGEAPARTPELSAEVARLRADISRMLPPHVKPKQSGGGKGLGDEKSVIPTLSEAKWRNPLFGRIAKKTDSSHAPEPDAARNDNPGISPLAMRRVERPPEILDCLDFLKRECGLDDSGAEQAIDHILVGRAVLGDVPTQQTIIAERFFDEGGGMQLVIHAPFGGRINRAWGLALRKRFCRGFNFELQASATDDGINIALAEQHSFPLADVFHFLSSSSAEEVLTQAVLTGSPYFQTRWRWDAERSLALVRFRNGKKVPPNLQRMKADDLLASVFPDVAACFENIEGDIRVPDHPLVHEVMKDVLHEAMDLDGFVDVLRGIESGEIRCLAVDTPVPSQFSHEILNANPYAFLDDAPLEERRARAVQMRRTLPESVLEEVGALDPAAIDQVCQQAWPDVRDADELHDALQSLIALPDPTPNAPNSAPDPTHDRVPDRTDVVIPSEPGSPANFSFALAGVGEARNLLLGGAGLQACNRRDAGSGALASEVSARWLPFFDQLLRAGRAGIARVDTRSFWVAAERVPVFKSIYPSATWEQTPTALNAEEKPSHDDAVLEVVTGWMSHIGPIRASELSDLLALPVTAIDRALLRLEATGSILRGQFRPSSNDLEWCNRHLLARIHRLTVGRLRKEIEPVSPAQFMNWLLSWQHVAPGTQLHAERGLLEVLHQLQGFEAPANAWERQVLGHRIAAYDPKLLDQLCLSGAIGWGRLSPHPATLESPGEGRRRVIPTSVAPITFFVREDSDWVPARVPITPESGSSSNGNDPGRSGASGLAGLSDGARQVLDFLRMRGASFFADIVRGTSHLKSEVETALWELVAAGVVTADGFDNLRSLIDPKRRSGHGHGRALRPRHAAGRWSLLYPGPIDGQDEKPVSHLDQQARFVESTCWMLLRRYGVIFRELLARENLAPRWRELLMMLRRLEDRGEIRGGRFVNGFLGEQFALPIAVESLRAFRRKSPTGNVITISAADPLNLIDIIVPGERVPAISGKLVAFHDGAAVEAPRHLPSQAEVSAITTAS